ncbi:MAG: prolipoprotein diacylglyceryl transferase [Acidimicrobiia bacterium]|nr:prolipoprotein diacylglyceryl transferase [Acidimicrobiia bacterium]
MFFASIPSPPSNTLELGPLTIHYYGILIGIGVVVAAIVTTRRYEKFGGNPAILDSVILWTVAIGFLGARIAYISTHTARYEGRWHAVFFIWEGGLALYGGLTAGALAAIYTLRKHGGSFPMFTDAVAVGLPLAQAIGRFGNYFNQELFGTPSTLPWAVEIDPANRPAEYLEFETFHPTFLYEALWNLLITVPVILYAERRFDLKRGASFPIYMILYGTIRFLTELLRTDTTFRLLGISRNGYVSIAAVLGGAVLLYLVQKRGSPRDEPLESEPIDSRDSSDT